jgi:hypothetical protein
MRFISWYSPLSSGKYQSLIMPNPSGRTRALGFTQPLTEMRTGNIKKMMFLGSKVRLVRGTNNLTAIYEPIV